QDVNLAGRLSVQLTSSAALTWRPYYWTERQPAYSAQSVPGTSLQGVRQRTNLFDREGSILETQATWLGARISLGYWFESFNLRISEKYYMVGADDSLVFNRWALDQPDGRGIIQSPYLTVAKNILPRLHVDAGVRYFHIANPGQIGYVTTGLSDMSYDQAL